MIATLAVLCAVVAVAPASAEARAFGSRTLKRGSVGRDVKTLQRFLTRVGFRTSADGVFGDGTYRTVRSWESAAERRVDGRVTRRDARVLRRGAARGRPPGPPRAAAARRGGRPGRPADAGDARARRGAEARGAGAGDRRHGASVHRGQGH